MNTDTLKAKLGIAQNTTIDGPKTITLDVQLIHRLKANGNQLLDAKKQDTHVWVLNDLDSTPKAEQVELASLPKEIQEQIVQLKALKGANKRCYISTGKDADALCFALAKPNANWEELFLEEKKA